jgi:hypothetical protein
VHAGRGWLQLARLRTSFGTPTVSSPYAVAADAKSSTVSPVRLGASYTRECSTHRRRAGASGAWRRRRGWISQRSASQGFLWQERAVARLSDFLAFLGPQDFRPFDVLFPRAGGAPPAPPGRSGARNSAGGLKAPPHAHLARRPRRPPRPRGGAGRARGGLTSARQFERMLLNTVPIGAVKAKAPPNNALAASLGGIPLAEATHQSVLVPARRSRCHWFVCEVEPQVSADPECLATRRDSRRTAHRTPPLIVVRWHSDAPVAQTALWRVVAWCSETCCHASADVVTYAGF